MGYAYPGLETDCTACEVAEDIMANNVMMGRVATAYDEAIAAVLEYVILVDDMMRPFLLRLSFSSTPSFLYNGSTTIAVFAKHIVVKVVGAYDLMMTAGQV